MSTVLTDSTSRLAPGPAAFKVQFDFKDKTANGRPRRPRPARTEVVLKARWSWGPVEQDGVIRNISIGGCFIETESEVSVGDKIHFWLCVPKLLNMQMAGMVVRGRRGDGFALRFNKLSVTEQSLLERAVRHLQTYVPPKLQG